ncbi:MAG: hypothetical protein FJY73_13445 [Candidatus Eisenbacteria bacterium]|nr:hypothetical protein [Candidatus Eisenbacteria bacterium]
MHVRTGFETARPHAALNLVIALDEFGTEVVALLRQHLTVLPEPLQRTVRIVEPSDGDLGTAISGARAAVTDRTNLEMIEAGGWAVEGRSLDRIRIRTWLLWSCRSSGAIPETVRTIVSAGPEATYLCCRFEDADREDTPSEVLPSLSLVCIGSIAQSGETVTRLEVVAIAAGLVLASLLPSFSLDAVHRPGTRACPGFSGFYGLVGPSAERLARHVAFALVPEQLSSDPHALGVQDLPEPARRLLEEMSPERLGIQLFHPEPGGVAPEQAIPAHPTWTQEGRLEVALNRSEVGLGLEDVPETEWPRRLRRYSSSFDRTRATTWRMLMERASRTIAERVDERFGPSFRRLLDSLPHAPSCCRQILHEIGVRIREERTSAADPTGDFEAALLDLREAIAVRPNPITLSLRTILWVVPALVFGAIGIRGLYDDFRGLAYSISWSVLGALASAAWVFWKVWKSHRRIRSSQDHAIDILIRRQEWILSRNAIAYLDEIVQGLADRAAEAESALARNVQELEEATRALGDSLNPDVAAALTFGPVLRKRGEYEQLFRELALDRNRWLEDAVEGGEFASVGTDHKSAVTFAESLERWCRTRLEGRIAVHLPGFADLWRIRAEIGGEGESLERSAEALIRRAAPLTREALQTEWRRLGVSRELVSRISPVIEGNPNLAGVEIDAIEELPILCCVRSGFPPRTEKEQP